MSQNPHYVNYKPDGAEPAQKKPKPHTGRYLLWAALLKRVFEVDILECPRCGGRLRLVCAVVHGLSARRYLAGTSPAEPVPEAQPPPQEASPSVTRA